MRSFAIRACLASLGLALAGQAADRPGLVVGNGGPKLKAAEVKKDDKIAGGAG